MPPATLANGITLQDQNSLGGQAHLLARCTAAVMALTFPPASQLTHAPHLGRIADLAAAVRRQLEAVGQGAGEGAVGSGGRSSLDSVPLLQLGWELDQLVGPGAGDVSNNLAVAATAGATGCNNDASGLLVTAGGDPRQTLLLAAAASRLPHLQAALHELWLRWHVAVWEGPDPRGVTGVVAGAMGAGTWTEAMSAPPVRLYLVRWLFDESGGCELK